MARSKPVKKNSRKYLRKKNTKKIMKKKYTRKTKLVFSKHVEKKHIITNTNVPFSFGKENSAGSGHYLFQPDSSSLSNVNTFFPSIIEGLANDDRVGQHIVLTGLALKIRIRGQVRLRSGGEYRIIIFSRKNQSCQLPDISASTLLSEFLDFDRMENSDLYTVSSSRNQENYKKFIVHYNKKFKFPADSYFNNFTFNQTGVPATYTIPELDNFKDHLITLKFNRPVRYDKKRGTLTTNPVCYGDMCLLFLANKGDIRTTGGDVETRQSGFDGNFYCDWYYTDC